jgi:hypothetical protein
MNLPESSPVFWQTKNKNAESKGEKMKKALLILMVIFGLFMVMGCGEDSATDSKTDPSDLIVGKWLSAGSNVAPLLTNFAIDTVQVEFKSDLSVAMASHVSGAGWVPTGGTYVLTKSASGNVHAIQIIYPTYEQGGIVEIIEGNPDQMKLEVVQTTPDIGATARTPETGFGSDAALGSTNIQKYVRVD